MSKKINIETIHESLINGQRKQMVNQIDEYGLTDFLGDYRDWLQDNGYIDLPDTDGFLYFADAVISYHRIKNG